MLLRGKLERPLRAAIRQYLQRDDANRKLRRLLFSPLRFGELLDKVNDLAVSSDADRRLNACDVGDETSSGFLEVFEWIQDHWVEILRLALAILALMASDPLEPEADPS